MHVNEPHIVMLHTSSSKVKQLASLLQSKGVTGEVPARLANNTAASVSILTGVKYISTTKTVLGTLRPSKIRQ